ncbi:MAG TPA: hypothetical protein PK500_06635 [Candidatus Egerieousia sp.]|nr:hypothetical protein [Candidatus Egerieousia sp.]HPT06310.1 hypothetical protein [Candidatus Egerieousia sp.]
MKNLREIKKDINYLASEVVSDCLTYLAINDNKNQEEVSNIIGAALDLRDEMVCKINDYPRDSEANGSKAGAAVKANAEDKHRVRNTATIKHFNAVGKEMLEKTDALFAELSKLSGSGKTSKA